MAEANKPFVVTDRRKFTLDGEVRPDAERAAEPAPAQPEKSAPDSATANVPMAVTTAAGRSTALQADEVPENRGPATAAFDGEPAEEGEIPAPTAEQMEQSRRAYTQTAERIETAIRSTNPGMEHPPAMNFEQLVQSIYLTAIMQLGGATAEGEQPRVDLLGARSSIDMMGVLADKTQGSLVGKEQAYLDSALFELRMAFLEMTQALARSAQARSGAGGPGGLGGFGGGSAPGTPTLVR